MSAFLGNVGWARFLASASLLMVLFLVAGCATTSPRERAEAACANAPSKDACVAQMWRKEVVWDQCKSQADSRYRQVRVADGQECKTTGTLSGSVYSGNTNCTPKYKNCVDIANMVATFEKCVAGTDQPSTEFAYRYRRSLAFFEASNNLNQCQ